jgi:beta-lactamase superfamily II metal-dependent hydrolase
MKPVCLAVLDVGHGNAAVLLDTGGVVVIDAGKGGIILDFLKTVGVKVVDLLLVSHADDDHVGSAPTLLVNSDGIGVRKAYYNSDASKNTRSWKAFREAIRIARLEKGLEAHAELTTSLTGKLTHGAVLIEILFPPPELAAGAPGGRSQSGESITSNAMSAVIRLTKGTTPCVLLAGDVEQMCLDLWKKEKTDPRAKILVYPHHGGQPGATDAVTFAEELCNLVKPETILFSIHRSQHELPIPDVVQKARQMLRDVRIVCTQLSGHCAKDLPRTAPKHLLSLPSRGSISGSCCAGTVVIDLNGNDPEVRPLAKEHMAFIKESAESALCFR